MLCGVAFCECEVACMNGCDRERKCALPSFAFFVSYGNDIDDDTTPVEATLLWTIPKVQNLSPAHSPTDSRFLSHKQSHLRTPITEHALANCLRSVGVRTRPSSEPRQLCSRCTRAGSLVRLRYRLMSLQINNRSLVKRKRVGFVSKARL